MTSTLSLSTPTQLPSPIFVLGAAHAGKSEYAQSLLAPDRPAVVVGTAEVSEPWMAERVLALKARRPPSWESFDGAQDLAARLAEAAAQCEQVLVDSVSQWLAGLVVDGSRLGQSGEAVLAQELDAYVAEFSRVIEMLAGKTRLVVVSAELGSGPPPQRPAERLFRRAVGLANQSLAARCATVVEVRAGLPLLLKPRA